jgi:hypothetical protein
LALGQATGKDSHTIEYSRAHEIDPNVVYVSLSFANLKENKRKKEEPVNLYIDSLSEGGNAFSLK